MNPVTALGQVPQDKLGHFAAGVIEFAACKALQFSDNVCLATVVVTGIAKELVYDKALKLGTPDTWDAISTGMGGLIGYSITIKF